MPKSYDSATVEFAMTLSTLAYVDENRTATQQQMIGETNAGLEEAGYKSWQVAWGPALNADRSNLAYAARNSETGQLAVSIRGSDFSFWLNWIEDLAAIRLVPYDQFVSTASKTAQIAFGTAIGLRQVLGMRDGTESLETFLSAAPAATPILITGHSLLPRVGPCTLRRELGGQRIWPIYPYHRCAFAGQYGVRRLLQHAVHPSIGPQQGFPIFQQSGRGAQRLGKPQHGRDSLPASGLLPLRHHQTHRPRRNSRGWEILSAWGDYSG